MLKSDLLSRSLWMPLLSALIGALAGAAIGKGIEQVYGMPGCYWITGAVLAGMAWVWSTSFWHARIREASDPVPQQ